MTTVLDAVATAIREEAKNFGALAHKVEGENAIEYRLARAALSALMNPTAEMLEAGHGAAVNFRTAMGRELALQRHQQMIRVALTPSTLRHNGER